MFTAGGGCGDEALDVGFGEEGMRSADFGLRALGFTVMLGEWALCLGNPKP